MRVISDADVGRLLRMDACIDAIEAAFRVRGEAGVASSSVAGLDLGSGGLHAKLGRLDTGRPYAAVKVNANFPANPTQYGLPTIQGLVVLFDASCGKPLAVLESPKLTAVRTAAASAVAARHLARRGATKASFIGCGIQARAHLEALLVVRPVDHLTVFDINRDAAERFALETRTELGLSVEIAPDVHTAVVGGDIVVTSTPSRSPIIFPADVRPGTFIAAVGADNEHKQEIDPSLLRAAIVVVDDLDQCSRIGDLHHALASGVLSRTDVRASLDQIVVGRAPGRTDDNAIIVFDSTGVAIEDVAAAALVYERMAAEA